MRVLREPLFYGETFEALRPGFVELRDASVERPDGRFEVTFTFHGEESVPLVRALMRAEAETLLEAAENANGPEALHWDPGELVAEAFVRVTRALGARAEDMELLRRCDD